MPYHFQLPLLLDLTIQQRSVLEETRNLALSGGPGTGKSVVSLWRHIRNHDLESTHSLLLTYTKCLELYLASSARSNNVQAASHVSRTNSWSYRHRHTRGTYAEIIIDEAQDITEEVAQIIMNNATRVSFGADDSQQLYSQGISHIRLNEIFNPSSSAWLTQNFRNSSYISNLIASLLPDYNIAQGTRTGPKPQLILSGNSDDNMIKIIDEIISTFTSATHNIAVLTPLITAARHRKKTVRYFYDQFKDKYECSLYENDQSDITEIASVHFSTFKSAKGLEFDTVIIPEFNYMLNDIANLYVVSKNDYYVAMSRAKNNLMLIDNESRGTSNLGFMSNQIEREYVEVNRDYISHETNNTDSDSDDLPF